MKNSHLGVKKVPAKELTKPVGFDLETNKRNEVWASHKQEDEEPEPFLARPVPSAIFKGPTVSKLFHVAPISTGSLFTSLVNMSQHMSGLCLDHALV